jgi:tetratricopeptide (TPR) repeat protein
MSPYLQLETSITQCRKNIFATVVIAVMLLATYWNTFDASWHFDDEANIVKREDVHLTEFTWDQIQRTFSNENRIYRPVACFSFALNYYFNQDRVFGYHVVNLFIHFLTAVFLFLFIQHALKLPLLKGRYESDAYFIALLSTVLWAINPVQIQAVTYIVQRMASMAAMFTIMSMYFYLRGRTRGHRPGKIALYGLSGLTGLLAFGSKENAAMLPVSIFLMDLFLIQGVTKSSLKRALVILLALAFIPIVFAVSLKGLSVIGDPEFFFWKYELRSFTLLERVLTQPRVVLWYISLLLYPMPHRLSLHHDIVVSHGLISPPTTIVAILVILAILCIALAISRKQPMIAYAIIFYFLNLVIESSILPSELAFEHRNYLPSLLFFVPIGILLLRTIQYLRRTPLVQFLVCAFVVLWLIGLAHSTFVRNMIWKTEESLWIGVVDKYPNSPRAHHNLGRFYANTLQLDKALSEYQLALEQTRGTHGETHHLTHYNLGMLHLMQDQLEIAKHHFLKAIQIKPRYSSAYINLGIVMMKLGNLDRAQEYLIKALTYNRRKPQAHNNLGYILLKKGRYEEAIAEFQEALRLDEDFSIARTNLGVANKYKENYKKAAYHFRIALRDRPRDLMVRLHLAEVYHRMGKKESGTLMIENTIDLFGAEKLHTKLNKLTQDDAPTLEFPDKSIVMPLLRQAYLQEANSLKEMGGNLWGGKEGNMGASGSIDE